MWEIENEVRRLALLGPLGPQFLPPALREGIAPPLPEETPGGGHLIRPLGEVELEAIRRAMERLEGHRSKVAEALGVSRSTLYLKLRENCFAG